MIDLDSGSLWWAIIIFIVTLINLAGFIGMAVVDFNYAAEIGSTYDTITGSATEWDLVRSAWLSAACALVIIVFGVWMIFIFDWNFFAFWGVFFCVGLSYTVFMIIIFTKQTNNACTKYSNYAGSNSINFWRSSVDLIILEREMLVQNESNFQYYLENYVTAKCGKTYTLRAIFLGLQSIFLFVFVGIPLLLIAGSGGSGNGHHHHH